MFATYVHDIDPILFSVAGVHVWWYGCGFALGFWQLHRFVSRQRASLALDRRAAYTLTLSVVIGVLAAGRLVEVLFDEWPFYRAHLTFVPRYWLGGMATHGLLLGAAAGAGAFSVMSRQSFLRVADLLVVPGALLMGLGRLGNFIDGTIVGDVTTAPWGVQFPYAEGFRHPVVLYDGIKNLLLVPYLMHVRRTNPTPGAAAARFVFWYACLRVFIDLFRDYPTHRLALGTGQTLNLLMTAVGAVLLARSRMRRLGRLANASVATPVTSRDPRDPLWWQPVLFGTLLLLCVTIPSNWTQNVPAQYGSRHPGLFHSWLYPDIDTAPP